MGPAPRYKNHAKRRKTMPPNVFQDLINEQLIDQEEARTRMYKAEAAGQVLKNRILKAKLLLLREQLKHRRSDP
jgi:hypothetical protein